MNVTISVWEVWGKWLFGLGSSKVREFHNGQRIICRKGIQKERKKMPNAGVIKTTMTTTKQQTKTKTPQNNPRIYYHFRTWFRSVHCKNVQIIHVYNLFCEHCLYKSGNLELTILQPGLSPLGDCTSCYVCNNSQILSVETQQTQQRHTHFHGVFACFSISKNKGVGVDNIHFLNDGLWQMKSIK